MMDVSASPKIQQIVWQWGLKTDKDMQKWLCNKQTNTNRSNGSPWGAQDQIHLKLTPGSGGYGFRSTLSWRWKKTSQKPAGARKPIEAAGLACWQANATGWGLFSEQRWMSATVLLTRSAAFMVRNRVHSPIQNYFRTATPTGHEDSTSGCGQMFKDKQLSPENVIN